MEVTPRYCSTCNKVTTHEIIKGDGCKALRCMIHTKDRLEEYRQQIAALKDDRQLELNFGGR